MAAKFIYAKLFGFFFPGPIYIFINDIELERSTDGLNYIYLN